MGNKDKEYKIKIHSANLFVPRVTLTPRGIRNYDKYHHELDTICTKTKIISEGDQNISWVPFTGPLPRKIYFFMISNEAYNGKNSANPYNFKNYGIDKFVAMRNNVALPLSIGFVDIQQNMQEIYQLSMSAINEDYEWQLPFSDYDQGYFIIAVNLGAGHEGNVRLAIDFSSPISETATMFSIG